MENCIILADFTTLKWCYSETICSIEKMLNHQKSNFQDTRNRRALEPILHTSDWKYLASLYLDFSFKNSISKNMCCLRFFTIKWIKWNPQFCFKKDVSATESVSAVTRGFRNANVDGSRFIEWRQTIQLMFLFRWNLSFPHSFFLLKKGLSWAYFVRCFNLSLRHDYTAVCFNRHWINSDFFLFCLFLLFAEFRYICRYLGASFFKPSGIKKAKTISW